MSDRAGSRRVRWRRALALGAVLSVSAFALASCGGSARAYAPWCAMLNMGDSIVNDCAYFTFDQCMATVRGIGGYCMRNDRVPETTRRRVR